MENSDEIWKDIPGYEGLYKISNFGRIYSLLTGTIRKDVQAGSGYRAVQLSDRNHMKKRHYVHRLVAEAFLGPAPSNTSEVNHLDFNKNNNCAGNLEWCSKAENYHHAYVNGKTDFRRSKRSDNTTGLVGVCEHSGGYEVSLCGKYLGWFKSRSEAAFVRFCAEREELQYGQN